MFLRSLAQLADMIIIGKNLMIQQYTEITHSGYMVDGLLSHSNWCNTRSWLVFWTYDDKLSSIIVQFKLIFSVALSREARAADTMGTKIK